ncbi:MAG: mechanosensitive ion channel [Candidatus Aenigmarchaeota archaeon]|nr:mechanosensitive ion channel [Candidatus Aenigmarchaeota archaeon]
MVESVFESFFTDVVNFLYALIPQYILPNLQLIIQVVVLLVVAFVVGKVIKVFAVKILNTIGLKRMTSRSWAESMLKVTGYRGSIVELIGDLVKWLIYILFLALIIQTLGLPGVADIFTSVAVFIPRFIGAILIIAIGFIIADFFGKIFEEATRSFLAEDILSSLAGGLVKYSIALIAIIMSLSLIGLDIISLTVLFSLILAAIIIVLVLGIKDVFPNYTAGIHIRKLLKPGEHVAIGKYSGVVEKLDTFSVILKNGERRTAIPNSLFLSSPIEKKAKS